jgi:hypothetical protein
MATYLTGSDNLNDEAPSVVFVYVALISFTLIHIHGVH